MTWEITLKQLSPENLFRASNYSRPQSADHRRLLSTLLHFPKVSRYLLELLYHVQTPSARFH